MVHCEKCNAIITGEFCSNCGRKKTLERIDKKHFWEEFFILVGYKSGFLFTIKNLLIRPGKTLNNYLYVDRDSFTKPTTFLVLTTVIHSAISHYLKTDLYLDQQSIIGDGNSTFDVMGKWVQNNYGYATLLMILPIAFWFKILFKKFNYNFFEVLFVICFVVGEGLLLISAQDIITYFFKNSIVNYVFNITFLYTFWALGQFYNGKIISYFKAFVAYLLGMLSFLVLLVIFAVLYHFIYK